MSADSQESIAEEPDVGAVIFACLQDLEAGRRPDRERLQREYPQFAAELETFFRNQDRLERLAAPLREVVLGAETGQGDVEKTIPNRKSGPEKLGALGDYELLSELGRGGMGVVYQARQRRLNRRVALKVLRADRFARPEDLQRFRNEAETIAALDHPNIVPIHEVGECDGRFFLALRLLEGGNLSGQLARFAANPRAAAALLITVARAVSHAHQRGVLHRDLKPSNILLDADGQPQVADFGLAKRQHGEPGAFATGDLTQTGAILGTPSYMAPEQTLGERNAVTTAADVYGLGGILYALLTGGPPFAGDDVLDMVMQVRAQAPPPPSRRNPRVDRDLETICLKCLEKLPSRRYLSALALVEDLERFLAGEPIQARRASAGERLWKWARRRPGMATLVALCLAFVLALLTGGVVYERRLRAALKTARDEGERADENYKQALAQGTRADENYQQARDTLHRMLQRTRNSRYGEVPRLRQLEREQAEDALAFYDKVARQQSEGPAVRQDIALACLEASKLQMILGQRERALELVRRANRLSEAALRDAPDDREVALLRADVLQTVGMAEAKWEQSTPWLERAVILLEKLIEKHPADPRVQRQLAGLHVTLSAADLLYTSKLDRAERSLSRAVNLYTGLLRAEPREREYRALRAGAQVNLAALYRRQRKADEVTRHNREAESDLDQAVAADPTDTAALRRLAVLRINGAYDLGAEKRREAALAYVTRNVAMLEAALNREPDHADLRDALRRTHGVRATMLDELNRYPECVKAWEQMMQYSSPADAAGPRYTLVELLRRAGDLNRAIEEADVIRKELTRSPAASGWKALAGHYRNLADDASKDGRLSSEQRRQLQDRLRAAAREAAEQLAKVQKKQGKE
jgi:tetratricopeptide (TPR) repeat protein